jgi:aminopeptidase N
VAIEKLKDLKGHEAVAKLSHALNHDAFYGVRVEAAKALESIHDDDSLSALLDSTAQSDARVRNQVMTAIAGFYDARAFVAERRALASEKNPDVQAQSIRSLGKYANADARQLLLPLLQSQSYRNSILAAAIAALSAQNDPADIGPLRDALKARKAEMTSRGFADGLDGLASLARNCGKKEEARDFIAGFVNDQKEEIQIGAIKALGTLEDPTAIPVLETFAGASRENAAQPTAATALEAIRSARQPGDNLTELRQTVLDLQKETEKLRRDLQSLQQKVDAKKNGRNR